MYIGVITHLLTIDPNFLGHPSTPPGKETTRLQIMQDSFPYNVNRHESEINSIYIYG